MKPPSEVGLIDLKSVAIVGEYTTPSGPYFDDHFLVVVLRSGKVLEYASSKAIDRMIPDLERAIGAKIEFRLCNRTDAASRVLFPSLFAEHPLFEFGEAPKGFFQFLKTIRNFGLTDISMRLTNELGEYIRSLGQEAKK
jgi:hypothetical protein